MKINILLIFSLVLFSSCSPTGNDNSLTSLSSIAQTVTVSQLIESHHPYGNNHDNSWEINAPEGALRIEIPFERLETESYYDTVTISDENNRVIHTLSGNHNGETFTVEGNYAKITLRSDYSVDGYGILINNYRYVIEEEEHATDHRPYCGFQGSAQEGWYWGDTNELIRLQECSSFRDPYCTAIGTRSEGWAAVDGWASSGPLIAYDNCHHTVRISLENENCGPSIGYSCNDGLYCSGLPIDTIGGSGICIVANTCRGETDCIYQMGYPGCEGSWSCQENQCVPLCVNDPVNDTHYGWTTVLLEDTESAHPYTNNFNDTWRVGWSGAEKVKLLFSKIDVENGYDYITVSTLDNEDSTRLTGSYTNWESPVFNADMVNVNLVSDYSVTKWGFKVSAISFYGVIPEGSCSEDSHCAADQICHPNHCINPYAPCYGTCVSAPQGGDLGDTCSDSSPCNDGLFCKNINDGFGTCREELWCDSETVADDCANAIHIAIPGEWQCQESLCSWQVAQFGGLFENNDTVNIPDNDPAGIQSNINISNINCTAVSVALNLDITHTYVGDLIIGVTDPSGTRHVVRSREGGSSDNIAIDELALPLGLIGVNGTWTLDVSDNASYDAGYVDSWSLSVSCEDNHHY